MLPCLWQIGFWIVGIPTLHCNLLDDLHQDEDFANVLTFTLPPVPVLILCLEVQLSFDDLEVQQPEGHDVQPSLTPPKPMAAPELWFIQSLVLGHPQVEGKEPPELLFSEGLPLPHPALWPDICAPSLSCSIQSGKHICLFHYDVCVEKAPEPAKGSGHVLFFAVPMCVMDS